jgi:2,4-dienoyl-CoA reductase-like NADH-dependent reductase (Old Yellow Enzyme family)
MPPPAPALHADVSDERVSALFQPITVRSLTIPNRFAMAPMTRMASPGGVPGPDVAAYYARRAAGGVGLIITEGVRIPHSASGFPFNIPGIDSTEQLSGWRAVTAAVHAEGGTIAAQLWHQGAQRSVQPDDSPDQAPVSPSGRDVSGNLVGHALSIDELGTVAQAYARAARNAQSVGFDAVELHGAHGYLLDEFLWDKTNLRTDGYGGSAAARTRFPAEVVAAVRDAVGRDFPIVFRFSQWKADHYDAQIATSPAELEALLTPLVDAGVDVLHPSARRHYLPAFPDADPALTLPGWTKKITGLPVIAVGSIGLQTAHRSGKPGDLVPPAPVNRLLEQYETGEFDVVALGRALLADPTWVNRLRDDALDGFIGYHADSALASLR